MGVGEIIEKARTDASLSRDELARTSGLTARTIFRVERHNQCSPGSLSLLARALGLSFEDLMHEINDTDDVASRGKNGDLAAVGSRSKAPRTQNKGV